MNDNYKMKRNLFFITYISLLIFSTGCGSYKTVYDQFEGISDNTLIIIISEFFPFEEHISNEAIKSQIIERLNQRASLVIASYISLNLSRNKISNDNDIILNNLMNEIISRGKLLRLDCSENNYCSANGEYDIAELKKKLESINNP